jgi:hypothetical protein
MRGFRFFVNSLAYPELTFCQGETSLQHHLALFHVYHNFVLPHASLRQPLAEPIPTNGTGSAKRWQPCTPAMAAGMTMCGRSKKCCSTASHLGLTLVRCKGLMQRMRVIQGKRGCACHQVGRGE